MNRHNIKSISIGNLIIRSLILQISQIYIAAAVISQTKPPYLDENDNFR